MKPTRIAALCLCLPSLLASAQEKTLNEVTVSATSDDVSARREAATQKVIITTQEIENMGALTVSDVMGKLPGVDAGTPGADGSMAMRARGMMRDSVQMYIDGEKVAGNARMAQAMVGRLPSTELERVEIVRGASAEFGGNAPVTVNLVFKKSRSKESLALKAAVGYRNSEPNAQFSITRGGGDKAFSWMLPLTMNFHGMPSGQDLLRSDSTGTRQQDMSRGETRIKEFVFSPRFTWKSGQDSLTLAPSLFRAFGKRSSDMTRTDLAAPAASFSRADSERNRTEFNRFRGDGEIVRDGVKYSARLAFSDGERRADTQRAMSTGVMSNEQNRRKERDLGGAFRLDWAMGKHTLAASLEESGHRRNESLTGSTTNESHSAWDRQWTAWVQDEWALTPGVTLTSGLRGEFIRYESDGTGQRYNQLLPSMAVKWEPAERWIVRSSLGAGIKPPRLDELSNQPVFSLNVNTPTEPDRRGNPNLRAEKSVNFEAVLERYLPSDIGVVGTNLYVRRTRDFIERRVQQEGARWVDRPYNEGNARHWGIELDGKLRTDTLGWRGATFRAHLTLPRSRVHDERLGLDRQARETPRYQLSAGYDQTMGEFSFGTSVQHFGQVRTEVPGQQSAETKSRTVLDAYVLRRLTGNLNLRLSLQNLLKTDTRKLNDMSGGGNTYHLESTDKATRAVLLSLEGKW